jgi:hypothetical protein
MAKVKQKNAYFDIGIVPIRQNGNKIVETHKYIVLPVRFAIYMRIPVVIEPPPPKVVLIKKGKLAGRSRSVQYSGKVSGVQYELGYTDPKQASGVKWIPIHVPRGLSTKEFLKVITAKIPKKPQFIRMPSGKSTRLTDA